MIDEIDTTDEAFLSALEPNYLGPTKLYPFSLMRQSAALSLGCSDKPEDAFWDAIVIVWLCTLDEDQVTAAKRNKAKAIKDAFAWGDSQGYSLNNYKELLRVYTKIASEIRRSVNASITDNGSPEKNSGGQLAS